MKKNKILLYGALLLCTSFVAFSQGNDNNFQIFISKIQPVLSKNVELLNKEDINILNSAIETSPNAFGEANSRLCVKVVDQAKQKKKDYDDYIASRKTMVGTIDELENEAELRARAEARESELLMENAELKALIENLQAQVQKFDQQAKKLVQANSKIQQLQAENLNAKELLQTSSDLVAQMLMLMPSLDNAAMSSLPASLRDSLEIAQCSVVQLLKSNFIITIQQLKATPLFLDSAIAYFAANQKHSGEIRVYIDNGSELVERLRKSGIDCAMRYASDIENEVNDFLLLIENSESNSIGNFSDFISKNIFWIVPICLVLLFGTILLIRKTSNKTTVEKQ